MDRWVIEGNTIAWYVKDKKAHIDDIEMTGLGASVVYQYGIQEGGKAFFNRRCIWPTLRTKPNDTHASFQCDVTEEDLPKLYIDGKALKMYPEKFVVDGIVKTTGKSCTGDTEITRTAFISTKEMNIYEIFSVKNISDKDIELEIKAEKEHTVTDCMGTKGVYIVKVFCDKTGKFKLGKGEKTEYAVTVSAQIVNKEFKLKNPHDELILRKRRIRDLCDDAVLETGNKYIDLMYRFCKLRTGEGVIGTKNGLFHSPGGCRFYASSFCNDQMEYATTWFSYVHDDIIEQSVIDMISRFQGFLYGKYSIPSSVICEGNDYWKLDRGDEAMFAYGVSHYLLARGSRELLDRFYGAAEYCLDFCLGRKNEYGVIESAYDELEGRFESGDANLSTSSLVYAALKNMKYLAKEKGDLEKSQLYEKEENELRKNINTYFGCNIKGYDAYRYYDGNDKLRAWICIPLVFGIDERKQGTKEALLSDKLWTGNAIYTEEGNITIWDRSTLYSIRGLFKAGYIDEAANCLLEYSKERLVRERTPYAVEAIRSDDGRGWLGESMKSHLSAESCVLCLAITDGLFGIEGTGLKSFKFIPRLPGQYEYLNLNNIHAFGEIFDININKNGYKVLVEGKIVSEGTLNKEVNIIFE